MKARNGKIARLPLEIREQLNARLADGELGNRLVEWLNSNPDVMKVMAEQFEGRPITEQNISEWRAGGYEEWNTLQTFLDETRVISENAGEIVDTGISSDHLHIVLLAHHAHLLQNLATMPENEFQTRLNTVKKLTASIMDMRRGELQKARLELQQERLEFLREKEAMKSASSEATGSEGVGSEGVGRGAGGGNGKARESAGDGNGKARESAGGVPGKSRAAKVAASTSTRVRPTPNETPQTNEPSSGALRSDIQPSTESPDDKISAPSLSAPLLEAGPTVSPGFGRIHPDVSHLATHSPCHPLSTSRIQSELSDPSVELPALRDWLDSVGLGVPEPSRRSPVHSNAVSLSNRSAPRSHVDPTPAESVNESPSTNPKFGNDWLDSVVSTLIQTLKIAA